ncbi:MAG: F0F1 ATP synthase subunit delta [Alphaproteobacteria bacterium]|nr:F0F1 ATP synthase subunit delta [Alphaproteobacteria bacterium]
MASSLSGIAELAERYSGALFDLALADKALDRVSQDLTAVKAAFDASEHLRRAAESPVLSREQKESAFDAVMAHLGASKLTRHFIAIVAQHQRLDVLSAIIARFEAKLATHNGEAQADVVSAVALSSAQEKNIETLLGKALGQKVRLTTRVTPEILGGLTVRIGSKMIDGSVRGKLDKLQVALKSASQDA